jgi:hypothetical protein
MKIANDLGMTDSEYLFLFYSLLPSRRTLEPWKLGFTANTTPDEEIELKKLFRPYRSVSHNLLCIALYCPENVPSTVEKLSAFNTSFQDKKRVSVKV